MELPGEKEASRIASYVKSLTLIGGSVLFVISFWFATKNELKVHADIEKKESGALMVEIQAMRDQELLNCLSSGEKKPAMREHCIRQRMAH